MKDEAIEKYKQEIILNAMRLKKGIYGLYECAIKQHKLCTKIIIGYMNERKENTTIQNDTEVDITTNMTWEIVDDEDIHKV